MAAVAVVVSLVLVSRTRKTLVVGECARVPCCMLWFLEDMHIPPQRIINVVGEVIRLRSLLHLCLINVAL